MKLKDYCIVIAGQSPEGSSYNDKGKGMEFHQGKKAFGNTTINHSGVWTTSPSKIAEAGDILMSVRAPVGPTNITDRQVCIGRGLAAIRCNNGVNPQFVLYALRHIENKIEGNNGAVFNSINKKQIEELYMPQKSLSEQHRIVSYLDTSFAQIDALAKQAEESLENAKALFQATLKELMEKKEGWEEKKLGKICDFIRGPFGGSLKKECFKEDGYAVYEQQNAIYNKFDFRYFIDADKYKSMIRFKVNPGDLIMSCSGTIGKVAIIPMDAKEGIINQALLKLTPHKEINGVFLKYLMESDYFKEIISSYSDGAAIKNIAAVAVLKDIVLTIPKVAEQHSIVQTLDTLSKHITQLQSNYTQTLANCQALKQALLRETFE